MVAVVMVVKRVDHHVVGPRQNLGPRVVAWALALDLALDHHTLSLGGVSDPWPGRDSVDGREARDWKDSERGRQKWVLFGTRETPYKVATHLSYATEQQPRRGGKRRGGGAEAT